MERVTFETLPPEMRFNILRFLDRRSLLNACCVNKAWYGLICPVTFVWERACRDLGLQLREGIQDKMCRALFVRLSQRGRSIAEASSFDKKCFADEWAERVTAIYYHDGRLATGSRCGLVTLWRCPAYSRIWVSERTDSCVTSVKFDDSLVAASYSDGTVRTFDPAGGSCTMTYGIGRRLSGEASSVDYVTDADLVVGAGHRILVWEMSSGRLVAVRTPHSGSATRVLVGPYPGVADGGGSDGRKTLLVAARLREHVMLWRVTSDVNADGLREVTMEVQNIIRADCLYHEDVTLAGDELFFDGEYLHFTTRSPENCNGVAIQWDVANDRIATEILFENKLNVLLGVGEKYMMAATSDDLVVDNLDVIERHTGRLIMRTRIIRFKMGYNEPGDIFCLGRRSWLDGFDGDNDYGPFAFFALHPNVIYVMEWNVLNWTHWIPHTQRNFRLR